jgi:multidrug efflux system membrane fusion protein
MPTNDTSITPRCPHLLQATGLALVTLVLACGHAAPPPPQAAPTVTVAPVLQRSVGDWNELTGQLSAVQNVEVRPQVAGYVIRVAFHEGTDVRAGDTLFVIDPRSYAASLATAEAQLAREHSALSLAITEAARAETLFTANATSRDDLETRRASLARARADVAADEAAVETARLNLEWTVVRAPIDGRVSNAAVTRGNYVQSGSAIPPLTSIVSQDPMYVYFPVDERSYLGQADGARRLQSVGIGLANEAGYPHVGRIDFVDNQLDVASGTIRVRAVVDNHDRRLAPGMFARVRLAGGPPHPATVVEDRAIGTDQDRKFVYVVKADSTVEYRPVQIGRIDSGYRVVQSGVAAGERVIVDGLQRVRPGSKVIASAQPSR